MSDFQTVAKVGDIPEGEGRAYAVNERMIAVFRIDGEYLAVDDSCPHAGASLASGAVDEDGAVVCPWHAWRFRLTDGCWLDNPTGKITAGSHEVRIEGDDVQVRVNGE